MIKLITFAISLLTFTQLAAGATTFGFPVNSADKVQIYQSDSEDSKLDGIQVPFVTVVGACKESGNQKDWCQVDYSFGPNLKLARGWVKTGSIYLYASTAVRRKDDSDTVCDYEHANPQLTAKVDTFDCKAASLREGYRSCDVKVNYTVLNACSVNLMDAVKVRCEVTLKALPEVFASKNVFDSQYDIVNLYGTRTDGSLLVSVDLTGVTGVVKKVKVEAFTCDVSKLY